jgi:ACS family tartrate transporter-like MFS transporter
VGESNLSKAQTTLVLPASALDERALLRKVTLRLIPFLCVLYGFNILDRNNVAFAKLTMLTDCNISEKAYGWCAGIFFIGYFIFQLPSNLSLSRIGARRWVSFIMVSWGLISICTMFVVGPWSFASVRFVLGLAESGFYPGVLLYLTFWYPAQHRARVVSRFMLASPLMGIVGGPLSGAVMEYMNGSAGLTGWQWLFLIEGVPAVMLGVMVWFYLSDRPDQASWLTENERTWLTGKIEEEHRERPSEHALSLKQVLWSRKVWHLTLLYTTIAGCIAGLNNYMPSLIGARFAGHNKFQIGLLSAIPGIGAMIGMVLVGSSSDRMGERRWHVAGSALAAALGWMLYNVSDSLWFSLFSLTLALTGMMSVMGPFWSMPTAFLSGRSAAAGIAVINAIGNLGGFLAPGMIGELKDASGKYLYGMILMADTMAVAALLAITVRGQRMERSGIDQKSEKQKTKE